MALLQVPRPTLGRPTDKRVDAAYLAAHGLPGSPFVTGSDIDLIDQINNVLAFVQAQVSTDLVVQSGTSAQRLALTAGGPLTYAVLFSVIGGPLLRYVPGVGWQDPYGNNPDAAPPPPDTGSYR
ncbi:hypothetical protein Q0M94_03385 [Deinococcus radiomollis]|uniref:hypothetical protein n=1 Tax=Deinococcus radiomollis TaxID=468916 RepID=UPI0038928D5E